MTEAELERAVRAAEAKWLQRWTAGPVDDASTLVSVGDRAPDAELLDDRGASRSLSEFWTDGPALVMFWRHFGCGCGVMRAERLGQEWEVLVAAGINPVIVSPGDPVRAAAYKAEHEVRATVLCDPGYGTYQQWGVGNWTYKDMTFTDPPPEFDNDREGLGTSMQEDRRSQGRPLVDDPWRGAAEFIVGPDGKVRLAHANANCIDFAPTDALTQTVQD